MLDLHGRHTHSNTHSHTFSHAHTLSLIELVELFDFLLEENFSSMKIDIFPGPKQLEWFSLKRHSSKFKSTRRIRNTCAQQTPTQAELQAKNKRCRVVVISPLLAHFTPLAHPLADYAIIA